jgi:hypothetical protein
MMLGGADVRHTGAGLLQSFLKAVEDPLYGGIAYPFVVFDNLDDVCI